MFKIAVVITDEQVQNEIRQSINEVLFSFDIEYQLHFLKFNDDLINNLKSTQLLIIGILGEKQKGLRFSKLIKEKIPSLNVLFVSSQKELVYDVFDPHVIGFIPINEVSTRLGHTLIKHFKNKVNHILINYKSSQLSLKIKDIKLVEYLDRRVLIHTRHNKVHQTKYTSMTSFIRDHSHPCFYRVNSYSYVNLDYVSRIEKNQLHLQDTDSFIEIARGKQRLIKQRLQQHLRIQDEY